MSYPRGHDQDSRGLANPALAMDLADRVTALSARVQQYPNTPPECTRCNDDHVVERGANRYIPCPECRPLQWLNWCAEHLPTRLDDEELLRPLAYRD